MLGLDTSTLSPKLSEVDIIQQWSVDNKKITAGKYQGQSYYFITQNGQDSLVTRENITGIPLSLNLNVLPAFLANTWVRISLLSDGQSKLSIQPKMCGGANINVDPARFWPTGTIPYEIDTQTYPVGEAGRPIILAAIAEWNNAGTGFQFIPRTNQTDVLVFGENDQGTCYSEVGRKGGVQYIRCHLEGHMFNKGSIMHEIGHAIGFNHEHQRYDRDNYLDLANKSLSDNVNYRKSPAENGYGSYDFGSIMHYSVNVLLTDGQQMNVRPGVFPPNTDLSTIGNRQTLSQADLNAAKALYQKTIQQDQIRQAQKLSPMPSVAASSLYIQELTRVPEHQILKQQGDVYFNQREYREAFKYYQALINEYGNLLDSNFLAQLHELCGKSLYNQAQYRDAQQRFTIAVNMAPQDKQIQTNYQVASRQVDIIDIKETADQFFAQKNYADALLQYTRLVKDYADMIPHLLPNLHDLCGLCCYYLGGFKYAAQWFANAHQLAPTEKKYATHYQAAQEALQKSEGCAIL